jgi:lipoprotein-releasing system permease protein
MASRLEWMIAARYLRPRRQEGFISVIAGFSLIGIALGVATLIVVMAVMNGFRAELLDRILGLNGHLIVQQTGGKTGDFDALARSLANVEGVNRATPIVEGQAMAMANGVASGALVRGIRPRDLRDRPIIADKILRGSLREFEGKDAVVIGGRLARKLGLVIGDTITLVAPQGNVSPLGTLPRTRGYRVVGTFEVGMYEYDSTFVFVPLEAAQIFFRLRDGVTAVEVMLEDPEDLAIARQRIFEAASHPVRIFDWQQTNSHFFTALQVERNVMFLILTLIILVAAFNIVSSLIMLVKEKGSDIAILRTMGATKFTVMRIFFLCGTSIGVLGTLTGFVLGTSFASNIDIVRVWLEGLTGTELWAAEIRFLSHLPAKIDSGEVVMVVAMGLGLSMLATIYPAWRASRLDPVEALRYE